MPIEFPLSSNDIPPPAPGGLGERLANGLRGVFENTIGAVAGTLASIIGRGIEMLMESLEAELIRFLDYLLDTFELPADARAKIRDTLLPPTLPQAPAWFLVILGGIVSLITGWLSGVGQVGVKRLTANVLFAINRDIPTFRISAEDGVQAERRGALSLAQIYDDLADLGVDGERAGALIARSYRWLTTPQIEELLFRRIIDHDGARILLKGLGLPDDQVEPLLLSMDRLVSASDLQRFGIREVFTPELAEPLKHPEPGERYYVEMAKLGFSRERAEWYWMAHWRLISEGRAQDVVRRVGRGGTIGGQDTKEWYLEVLRRDDVLSKYWEPMWDTRFRPLNRLDIWRMGISGRFTSEEMFNYYQDYGYSPDLSRRMADLASEDMTAESRLLSQSLVQDAYKRRVISREAAYNALIGMRFRPEDANLVLTISDLQKQSERAGERTSIIRQRFLSGLISDSEASGQLSNLGKPAEEIADLLELWRAQAADKVEAPPVSTLETWYKRRIISGPRVQEELRHRGYEGYYVNNYLLEWDQEIQETEEQRSEEELRRRQAQLKVPTRADLAAWVKAGLITLDDFSRRLTDQGYSAKDVANYARLVGLEVEPPEYTTETGKVQVATLRELYRRDAITIKEHETGLVNLGMTPELASAIATYELARTL